MHEHTRDRVFAAFGIGFVVILLAGVAFAGDLHGGGLSDSTAKVAADIAKPVPPHAWIGAYLEMLAVGCFLAFATWATAKLGGGVLAQLARTAAAAYAAVTVTSLGLLYGVGYRYGHGLTVPVSRTFDAVNKGVYVGSWFLTAFFLLAVGALAVGARRRLLGWSGIGAGVITLAAAPSIDNFGEIASFLFFIWVVAASIALARSKPTPTGAVAAPQHA